MPFLELFDETLDINSSENYELSVEVGNDSISFCILDTIRNKFILLRSWQPENSHKYTPDELTDIVAKDDFLTKKYKKTNVVIISSRFTLVPSALFDPGKKDDYFSFNHISPENNLILNNRLSDPDSFLVYSVPQSVHTVVKSFWPGINPFHHVKPLFDHFREDRRNSGDTYVHIHIERDFFNLFYYSAHSLKFCNSFSYRNVSDIMYYVLNMFKSMDIRQEETIYLSGQAERYDDLFSNLALYIRNIRFAQPAGNFTFSYVFNETGLHRYLNLFSSVNCV